MLDVRFGLKERLRNTNFAENVYFDKFPISLLKYGLKWDFFLDDIFKCEKEKIK